jgi:hypothetical protein
VQWPQLLNKGLKEVDPELYDIIEHEKNRQYKVRTLLSTPDCVGFAICSIKAETDNRVARTKFSQNCTLMLPAEV